MNIFSCEYDWMSINIDISKYINNENDSDYSAGKIDEKKTDFFPEHFLDILCQYAQRCDMNKGIELILKEYVSSPFDIAKVLEIISEKYIFLYLELPVDFYKIFSEEWPLLISNISVVANIFRNAPLDVIKYIQNILPSNKYPRNIYIFIMQHYDISVIKYYLENFRNDISECLLTENDFLVDLITNRNSDNMVLIMNTIPEIARDSRIFELACKKNVYEIVKLMIDKGITITNVHLEMSVKNGLNQEVFELLIGTGRKITTQVIDLIMQDSSEKNIRILKRLGISEKKIMKSLLKNLIKPHLKKIESCEISLDEITINLSNIKE